MISEVSAAQGSAVGGNTKMFGYLREAMHAIAQPLTILQGRLDKSMLETMSVSELRAITDEASDEADRLCTLFGYMQFIITAESVPADIFECQVEPLLSYAAEGLRLFFEEADIALRVDVDRSDRVVLADEKRMHQALSRMLLAAYSLSSAGDTIELTASPGISDGTRIVIVNKAAKRAVDKETKLKIACSETNLRSQHGSLIWTENPFRVQIELPGVSSVEGEEV